MATENVVILFREFQSQFFLKDINAILMSVCIPIIACRSATVYGDLKTRLAYAKCICTHAKVKVGVTKVLFTINQIALRLPTFQVGCTLRIVTTSFEPFLECDANFKFSTLESTIIPNRRVHQQLEIFNLSPSPERLRERKKKKSN